jgi:hypothetical protein
MPLLEAGALADGRLLTGLRESRQAMIKAPRKWVRLWAADLPGL